MNNFSNSYLLFFTCSSPVTLTETYEYLKTNFERHYTTSKAPFGVYLTANGWFTASPPRLEGYKKFLDFLATKDDVWIVPIGRVKKSQTFIVLGNYGI